MRRWLVGLGVLLAALALTGVLAAAHVVRALEPVAGAPDAPSVDFEVARGASLGRVTRDLQSAGLIRDARVLGLWARWQGLASRLQAGEYAFSPSLGAREILEQVAKGQVKTYEVVLPEGIRATEIAARLEALELASAEAFLSVVNDPGIAESFEVEGNGLEGYLYPETYRFPRGLSAREIASAMVKQFHAAWRQVAPQAAAAELSMREVVTLASIVEKETGAPDERPLIAAVFLNRLDRGMRLETDPTVIYGIPDFDGNIKKRHLLDAGNPYNTYKHAGLPPGPIASPGLEALRAVVEPAESEYLYFVSMNDGTHKFSRSYREHVNAVNRYQKRRRSK